MRVMRILSAAVLIIAVGPTMAAARLSTAGPLLELEARHALAGSAILVLQEQAQHGTITGRVVERRSMRPISAARVFVEGTGIGTLTNAAGRYLLPNVPAGRVVVRVQLIGYTEEERVVQVVGGETAVADFEITEQALALDQIVVTGTPGGTQRRAIGNVVDRVD